MLSRMNARQLYPSPFTSQQINMENNDFSYVQRGTRARITLSGDAVAVNVRMRRIEWCAREN